MKLSKRIREFSTEIYFRTSYELKSLFVDISEQFIGNVSSVLDDSKEVTKMTEEVMGAMHQLLIDEDLIKMSDQLGWI